MALPTPAETRALKRPVFQALPETYTPTTCGATSKATLLVTGVLGLLASLTVKLSVRLAVFVVVFRLST